MHNNNLKVATVAERVIVIKNMGIAIRCTIYNHLKSGFYAQK